MAEELKYSSLFWEGILTPENIPRSLEDKLHLVLSLIIFLSIPLSRLLVFLFSCDIQAIRNRVSIFMGHHRAAQDPEDVFLPSTIYKLWHTRWPKARKLLHEFIIQPCASEIAVKESDKIIHHPGFRIKIEKLTISGVRELLSPTAIIKIIREKAPFTYGYLHAFTTAPNTHRRRMGHGQNGTGENHGLDSDLDNEEDERHERREDSEAAGGKQEEYHGFSRNPVFVSVVWHDMTAVL